MEDAQVVAMLVRRCIAGDVVAWEEIVQRYNRRIYNICYRFAGSGDDAQDLTQEVFIKMFRTLSSYDVERGAFMTWVTTITRNLLVDHFRKSKQDRMTESLDAAPSEHEDAMPLSEKIEDKAPPADASPKVQMAYKLKTAFGKAIYRVRKCTVEPVIGIIKEVLGFRQFSLRGEPAVTGEWCLVCVAFNLKRLHSLLAG